MDFPLLAAVPKPHLVSIRDLSPLRHICAHCPRGTVDLDTSTPASSLISSPAININLPLHIGLTSHKTFLLIKPKNRLPSDRSITAPFLLHPILDHRHRHRRLYTVIHTTNTSHNGHDTATACGILCQWSPTAPQDEHRFPCWSGQRRHRDERQLLRSRSRACSCSSRSTNLPDALLPARWS